MNNEIKPIVIRAELHYPKWVQGPEGPATYDLSINDKGELEATQKNSEIEDDRSMEAN